MGTTNKKIVLTSVAWSVVASIAVSIFMQGFLLGGERSKTSQVTEENTSSSSLSNRPVVSGETIKKEIIKTSYMIQGQVKEVGTNFFVVEANIVDLTKLDSFKPTAESTQLPSVKKRYHINVNDATDFGGKTLASINIEGAVVVESVEGIYTQDTLMAKKVTIQK